jgi:hypothetical protein
MIWGIARTGAAAMVLVLAASTTSFAGGCRGDWSGRTWAQWYADCSSSVSAGYDDIQELRAWPQQKWEAYQQQQRDDAARRQYQIDQDNLRIQQARTQALRAPLDNTYLDLEKTCANSRVGCDSTTQQMIDKWRAGRTDLPPPPSSRAADPNAYPNPGSGPALGPLGSQQPPGGGVGGIRLNVEVKRVEPTQDMTDIRNQVLNLRSPAASPKARGMLDD